jgi:uncharacterized protein YcbK (DUF882 family)
MSVGSREVGTFQTLLKRGKKFLATASLVTALCAACWVGVGTPTLAGGETRTISLYHVHTKESLTVTYMVNGRYVPSAMKQINYLLRDWRRNEVITIDPRTIDLMYELHADLRSHAPVHIVCGYRSPRTNAFLKRIGRNVARQSQHMVGKAIDIYFPDVATKTIRDSALVRQVGGVGYYRSAGGPTGFLHIDSGHVRHWGPAISRTEMAMIFRNARKTIGARFGAGGGTLFASAKPVEPPPSIETAYDGSEDDMAAMSEEASQAPEPAAPVVATLLDPAPPVKPVAKPALEVPAQVVQGYPVPKPRPKPIEVLMMAAANMKIEPASAPPPTLVERTKPSVVANNIGVVEAATSMTDGLDPAQTSNASGKGSFAAALRDGTAKGTPLIKPLMASASSTDINWWPESLIFNPEATIRRDGAPQAFSTVDTSVVPTVDQAHVVSTKHVAVALAAPPQANAQGKGDMLVVDRSGKGSLPGALPDLLQGKSQ